MPEANAQLVKPSTETPIKVDEQLNQIRQQAGISADQAIGNQGTPHNPVPIKTDMPNIPDYIPKEGESQIVSSGLPVSAPKTFTSGNGNHEHFMPDIVKDITGHHDSPPPRTGSATEIINLSDARQEKVQQQNNQGTAKPNKGFLSWFYDEKKAA